MLLAVFLLLEKVEDKHWNLISDLVIALCADDGTYAMKKVLIQNSEQLELVREEIRVSSLFSHSNLLPLLDHAIISVKVISGLCVHLLITLYHSDTLKWEQIENGAKILVCKQTWLKYYLLLFSMVINLFCEMVLRCRWCEKLCGKSTLGIYVLPPSLTFVYKWVGHGD